MQDLKWKKPATACDEPASNLEQLGGPLGIFHTPTQITAQLVGNDIAVADNITANGALDLCRRLLTAGAKPNAELICYRGEQIALRVRSIGAGAKLTVREDGLRVVPWKAFSRRAAASPIRQTCEGVL